MKPAAALHLNTDALSPMLVKELRQGVKSKAFGFSFLLMQGLMVFCVLMAVTALKADSSNEFFDVLFWICLGATLVFITPLRAMSALQQEIRGNTLELIFLTRLSAWRIVAGKWAALYSQALLLTTAALPYLLLRYFMGGIDVAADLKLLFRMLVASAALTAAGVCISTTRAQWMRGLVIALSIFSPYLAAIFISTTRIAGAGMRGGTAATGSAHPLLADLMYAVYAGLATVLLLSWGAGRIAPDAENHARWKRLIGLAMVALLPLACAAAGDPDLVMLGLVFLIPICADALCEAPRTIRSVFTPFTSRGVPGCLAGLFLFPGWPNGLLFTLALLAVFGGVVGLVQGRPGDPMTALLASVPGALLFPSGLILALRPRTANLGPAYLVIQIAFFIVAMIALALHAAFPTLTLMPLSLLPPVAFVLHLFRKGGDLITPLTALASAAALVLLLMRLRYALAAQRRLLREAVNSST